MKNNTKINVISAVLLQFITVICGFVLPRLIIQTYGSEVNGLISSLNQFLGYISLMEGGVGGVVVASLYRPLVDNNTEKVSGIVSAANVFFKKIASIFMFYTVILAVVYPFFLGESFSYTYIASLIFILSIGYFIQYYFAIVYRLLLQAGQKLYVVNAIQIITILSNTIVCVVMIKLNVSIHVVRLFSSLVFIIQPIVLEKYIAKEFEIDKSVLPDNEALSQRWNGFGQNIAFFIHTNTDIIIITLFLKDLTEVSVYSVYLMIVLGLRNFISAVSGGISPTLGNLIAQDNIHKTKKLFDKYEFTMYNISIFAFTCCALLIVEFVKIYTSGITDCNYERPTFAIILILAEMIYCIRDPYVSIVYAAGHYKETAKGAYLEAAINIIASILLVNQWGLEGVATGTLVAMLFRMCYHILYIKRNIIMRPIVYAVKRIMVSIIIAFVSVVICSKIEIVIINNYLTWFFGAVVYAVVIMIMIIMFNYIFYKDEIKDYKNI